MSAAIAVFTAAASGEVLVRLAVDSNLDGQAEHVLLPLAFSGLAASLAVIAALLVVSARTKGLSLHPRRARRAR